MCDYIFLGRKKKPFHKSLITSSWGGKKNAISEIFDYIFLGRKKKLFQKSLVFLNKSCVLFRNAFSSSTFWA